MDDENEVLDWEEDEEQTTGLVDDADGVSLGSESGDENPNAAPPASASSASIRASVLPSQDANGASRPVSPKPSTPLQREGSHSSLKPNDVTPIASPNSQNRSHRSKSKPISSIQMIHGLPAKPVVSAVPRMPLSNSSLTEATAMATRESGKGKSGGGSKSTEISLPPNWEVRHSQSTKQVYYYNNRTHQSTWERPSSHQSTREHHGDSAKPSLSSKASLSFEDRHYRPSDGPEASLDDAYERGNRFNSPGPGYRRSPGRDPSPYSKRRTRSASPGPPSLRGRDRDSGRHARPSQPISAKESRHANRDRDRDVLQASDNGDSDRHWSPSPIDFESSRSRPYQRPRQQEIDEGKMRSEREQPISRITTHSRRGARDDREQDLRESQTHSSNHKHRSPPPRTHEQKRSSERSPSVTTTKRDRPTRFGTPPQQTALASDHDDWVPDELLAPSDEQSMDRSQERSTRTDLSAVDMYESAQPSQPAIPSSDPQPRRKRPPLPPQSTRFREMSRNSKLSDFPSPPIQEQAPSPPRSSNRPPPPTATRDLPPHQRPAPIAPVKNDDLVASSRNQSPPSSRPREDTNVKERREDVPTGPARSADDSSSLSSRMIVDTAIRPGSGMYADRESLVVENDVTQLPRAPRAMDTAASRQGSIRDRSPPARGLDRNNGPQYQPDRPRKDDIIGLRGRGGRSSRARAPPVLSGTNNVPVGNRIGADGIPNGPARSSLNNPTPRLPLSSANLIPVTNNRYAAESSKANEELKSPSYARNGEANDMRHPRNGEMKAPASAQMMHGRDGNESSDYERGRTPPSPVHKTPGVRPKPPPGSDRPASPTFLPVFRQREPTPPPPSRKSTSPRWEPSSDRGRSGRGKSLEPEPSNGDHPQGRERRGQQSRQVNGGRPPSPPHSSLPLSHGLPPKPMLRAPSPGFNRRPRGALPNHQDRGPSPPRDWSSRNGRSISPVDARSGQRRPLDRYDGSLSYTPRRDEPMKMEVDPPHHRRDHKGPYDSGRRGGSLLDRLGISPNDEQSSQSGSTALRDRVQIPTKRDREEMIRDDDRLIGDFDMDDGFGPKRAKRRSGKSRRGRGRS